MKARMPEKRMGGTAEVGDILAFGRFMQSGSPARDKEPYVGFRKADDPFVGCAIRYGCVLEILNPLVPQVDRRQIFLDTRAYYKRSMRENLPTVAIFLDTKEMVLLREFSLDTKFRVIEAVNYSGAEGARSRP